MSLNHRVLGPVLMLAGLIAVRTGLRAGWGGMALGLLIGILLAGAGYMVFLKDRSLND